MPVDKTVTVWNTASTVSKTVTVWNEASTVSKTVVTDTTAPSFTEFALTNVEFDSGWWTPSGKTSRRTNHTGQQFSFEFTGSTLVGVKFDTASFASTPQIMFPAIGYRVYATSAVSSKPDWTFPVIVGKTVFSTTLDSSETYRCDVLTMFTSFPNQSALSSTSRVTDVEKWRDPEVTTGGQGTYGAFYECAAVYLSAGATLNTPVTRQYSNVLSVLVLGDSVNEGTVEDPDGSYLYFQAQEHPSELRQDPKSVLATYIYKIASCIAEDQEARLNYVNSSYGGYFFTTWRFPRDLPAADGNTYTYTSLANVRSGTSTPAGAPAFNSFYGFMNDVGDEPTKVDRLSRDHLVPRDFVPQFVFFAMGQNDQGLVDSSDTVQWVVDTESDFGDILDTIRARYPGATIIIIAPHTNPTSKLFVPVVLDLNIPDATIDSAYDRTQGAIYNALQTRGYIADQLQTPKSPRGVYLINLSEIETSAKITFNTHPTDEETDIIKQKILEELNLHLFSDDPHPVGCLDFSNNLHSGWIL